ncbi:hypothetical protein QR680_004775 [Steinernema hermaphroditum]|uniref:THO complex subunit 7 homolog n=1 Tax=Steinernema hermaphroditum TaxID=289476 RepID=A0AA39HQV0_9BILA|nr:hypothetical protein QR680_004775 [Steinernema hermaphroditum]
MIRQFEQFLKRKVVADGNGMGDGRKFALLLVQIQEFCCQPTEDRYEQIVATVADIDFTMIRSVAAEKVALQEKVDFQKRVQEIQHEKEALEQKRHSAEVQLERAETAVLRNKECKKLVKTINAFPKRSKTEKKIAVVEEELQGLYGVQQKRAKQLEDARNHVEVVKNIFARFDTFEDDVNGIGRKRQSHRDSEEEPKEKRRHKSRDSKEDRHGRRNHRRSSHRRSYRRESSRHYR